MSFTVFVHIIFNGLGFDLLCSLLINLANTCQTENPYGFSEGQENKQLLIAIVTASFLFRYIVQIIFPN